MDVSELSESDQGRAATRRRIARWWVAVGVFCLVVGMLLMAPAAHAAPPCVNPGGTGGCTSTIQAAVTAATSGDTITIASGTYTEHVTITGKVLTFVGAGAGNTIVNGSGTGRVFSTTTNIALVDLTVQNGKFAGNGGGLYTGGTLTLTGTQFLSNTSTYTDGLGGGLYAVGAATLTGGLFHNNACTGKFCRGGGLFANSTLTLTGTHFLSNTATFVGGGAYSSGAATVNGGLFQNNACPFYRCDGGGLRVDSTLTLTDTRFLSNTSTSAGGGLCALSTVTLTGAEFFGNTAEKGGGLYTGGNLTLTGTHFFSNMATGFGGGLFANSTLTLTDAQFLSNRSASHGGGAYTIGAAELNRGLFEKNTCTQSGCKGGGLFAQGSATLTGTQFLSNTAGAVGGGGGLFAYSSFTLTGAAFISNTSGSGGGLAHPVGGAGRIANALFLGNSATTTNGGAIYNGVGDILLANSTLVANTAANAGGGLHTAAGANSHLVNVTLAANHASTGVEVAADGATILTNTLVAGTNPAVNCTGNVTDGGHNLDNGSSCGFGPANVSQSDTDPLLGPLGNYGGGTQTVPLLPGSSAIEGGDAAICAMSPVDGRDQRGVTRPQGTTCDIGAFESQGFTLLKRGGDNQQTSVEQPFAVPLSVAVTGQSWDGAVEPVDGGVLLFSAPIMGAGVTFAPTTTQVIAVGAVSLPVTANAITGSFGVTVTGMGVISQTFTLTNTRWLAVNDAAGMLQDNPVTIAVLVNDFNPTGSGLSVTDVTQPIAGSAAIDAGNQTVTFTPAPGTSGVFTFTYVATDINGRSDDALVSVMVSAKGETESAPQVVPVNPVVSSTVVFTSPQVSLEMELVGGFYTGTLTEQDIFTLVYTPILTPTGDTNQPPGGLMFGNYVFDLSAYVNGELRSPISFAEPVTLTFTYDPALLDGLDESTLMLYYWNGAVWANDGITVVERDVAGHTLTVMFTHLSEFAFFAAESENDAWWIYLPAIMQKRAATETAAQPAARVEPEGSRPIYLPLIGRDGP